LALRNLVLSRENLPQSNVRLKRSECISTQSCVGYAVYFVGRIDKLRDAFIRESREFSEGPEPATELRIS